MDCKALFVSSFPVVCVGKIMFRSLGTALTTKLVKRILLVRLSMSHRDDPMGRVRPLLFEWANPKFSRVSLTLGTGTAHNPLRANFCHLGYMAIIEDKLVSLIHY